MRAQLFYNDRARDRMTVNDVGEMREIAHGRRDGEPRRGAAF